MSEAEHPLEFYDSIEAVFTRALKPGRRSIAGVVCSPADGTLARSEPALQNMAVQAKGFDCPLPQLIRGTEFDPGLTLNWFFTVYLAPHNYHRVHSPVDGSVERITHIPGKLWPVNDHFIHRVHGVFSENERLVFDIRRPNGGMVYVVMVGAFNVGRMETVLAPGFVTNASPLSSKGIRKVSMGASRPIKRGDELGVFMLGSTVVVAFDSKALEGISFSPKSTNQPILMGTPIDNQ